MEDLKDKRCPGCGARFQRNDPDGAGYLPEGKDPDGNVICKRCFQMKHYGVFKKASIKDSSIKRDISREVSGCSAIFLVVDICQFEISSSALDWVADLNKPVFVVINKCDVLSKWITPGEIASWASERLSVPLHRIHPLSALNRKSVRDLRNRIEDAFPPGSKILLLGTTNVGKSTILSGLTGDDTPTISRLPGTTLGITQVKSRHSAITYVDVPGLKEVNPWLGKLCADCLTGLIPQKKLQSYSTVLKPGQCLSLGAIDWFVVDDAGERGWIKVEAFAADEMIFHRTTEDRLHELLAPYREDLFSLPCSSCWASLEGPDYVEYMEDFHVGLDIVLPGCGWFSVRSGYGNGRFYLPKGISPILRPVLVPSQKDRKGQSR
ncbi:MAG: GTPase [Synergistota bacterium]|nr:GTPase [Synergistota bacterium]